MEQQPFQVKFPDGTKLTFADICDRLNLNNGIISFADSGNTDFVAPVVLSVANKNLASVSFHPQKDGMHIICFSDDDSYTGIQVVMKDKIIFDQRITAMMAAVISYNLVHPIITTFDQKQGKNWLKSTYKKFLNRSSTDPIYQGCGSVFIDFNAKCKEQLKKAAGLTVECSTNRIRQEFSFLVNHVSEDHVIQLWRETITAQVHNS